MSQKIKIGFDTCFLCNLISKNIDIKKLKERTFPNNSYFYYCYKVETELIRVLVKKGDFKDSEAREAWERIREEFDLSMIKWTRDIQKEYIPKVSEANERVIKKRYIPKFAKTYDIGQGDKEIIAIFMKANLDRIYTSDDAFHLTCKELGLNAIKVKLQDYEKMPVREEEGE